MKQSISAQILDALKHGKNQLGSEALIHLSDFIKSQKMDDESFMNKAGKSDLYYTLFGWMLCLVLDIQLNTSKMADYLKRQTEDELDLIHYAVYKRCQLIHFMMLRGKALTWIRMFYGQKIKALNAFKNLPHNDQEAPYTQFIWLSLLEDTGNKTQNTSIKTLAKYKTPGGGYRNLINGKTATTNATVASLSVFGQINGYQDSEDLTYLRNLQKASGGFAAAESSPIPDLLSTATAAFLLHCYGQKPNYPVLEFIEAHWAEKGGFSATLADEKSDVEYCFYGLLALGCA